MIVKDRELNHIATDINYEGRKWGALVTVINEEKVYHDLRWGQGSKVVHDKTFKKEYPFPLPPDAPEALVDVGKECDKCSRNMGMYPIAPICQYCRPVPQENGDVITGVAYSPAGTNEFERVPNTYLSLDESGCVSIQKGQHANCVWLNDAPELSADGAHSFMLGTTAYPPPTYWVRFK